MHANKPHMQWPRRKSAPQCLSEHTVVAHVRTHTETFLCIHLPLICFIHHAQTCEAAWVRGVSCGGEDYLYFYISQLVILGDLCACARTRLCVCVRVRVCV